MSDDDADREAEVIQMTECGHNDQDLRWHPEFCVLKLDSEASPSSNCTVWTKEHTVVPSNYLEFI